MECISKENATTGYLFCCNGVYISCIVQHSTSDTCYFVLTYENEQFCLSGPFNLNSLVKKVNDIYALQALWNSLLAEIRNIQTLTSFKQLIYTYSF